jgi:hypothetical protein
MTEQSRPTSEQTSGTVHKGLWFLATKMACVVAAGGDFFLPVALVMV